MQSLAQFNASQDNMAWRGCVFRLHLKQNTFNNTTGTQGWGHCFQQRCGFKKTTKKPEVKKVEEPAVPSQSESAQDLMHHKRTAIPPVAPRPRSINTRGFNTLVKPLVFTVGFTGCSFGAAAIWQYESLKSRVQSYFDQSMMDWLDRRRPNKQGDLRKEINQWWQSLSEGQRTATGIIAANILVFCCWRIPSLQPTMIRYFTSNPASKKVCSPMVLSAFSHHSLFHLAANMYVLWSFSNTAVSMLGREQFMAVYMSAGAISTFASYMSKTATGRFGPSLGASGAILTILAAVCTKMPESKLALIFLPDFTFTAGNGLKFILAMDTAGVLLGWRFFDHAAHLGGALFGIWYIMYGHELIWKNREPFVKIWHDLRTRGSGGGAH